MNKIKAVKIRNEDGSISEESYNIAIDALNVDMANGRDLQDTIGNINVDEDGSVAEQLKHKIDTIYIEDNLNSTDIDKALSANQGRILNNGLNKKLYYFNTVADMKNANLKEGDVVITEGFYLINDGGKAIYKIKQKDNNTIVNNMNIISITSSNNQLIAELIEVDKVNLKQLGAYGNNIQDDTEVLNFAIDNYKIIKIPVGTFLFNNTINVTKPITIIGENRNLSVLKFTNLEKNAFDVYGSYVLFNKIKLLLPNNYTGIGISLSPKVSNVVSQVIKECNIMGSNYNGTGIGFINNNYGASGTIIDDITFNRLENCIYFNVTDAGWTNGIKISNCWEWGCVYGINYNDNTNNINTLEIRNFKGQYSNNITKALINNVIGNNTIIDSCFIWDGAKTIVISQKAKYTIIKGCYVYDKDKITDNGYHTEIEYPDQRIAYERRYKFSDDFFGADLTARWRKTIPTEGGEAIAKIIAPTTGLRRPAMSLTTPAVADKSVIVDFGNTPLNATAPYKISFDLNIHDLTNLRFYVGCDIGGSRPQGNFLSIDTAVSNDLKFINKTYSDIGESITLLPSNEIQTNIWYHIEISYYKEDSNYKCDIFFGNAYFGTLETPQTYNAQPYFYLRSLENAAKQISIANLKLITYIY